MKRQEFLTALIKELRSIEANDLQDVLAYYNEYLDDAGAENEEAAIAELGNPANIAAQIKANTAMKYIESQPKGGKNTFKNVWLVIGSIFAAPIALPIAIALFAVVFALFISLFAVLFALTVSGMAMGVAGVMSLIMSVFVLFESPIAAASFFGIALVVLSLGTLITIPLIRLTRLCASKLGLWLGKILSKNSKPTAVPPQYYPQAPFNSTQQPNTAYTNAVVNQTNTSNNETVAPNQEITETNEETVEQPKEEE